MTYRLSGAASAPMASACGPGEAGFGDGELEVIDHFVAVDDLTYLYVYLVASDEVVGLHSLLNGKRSIGSRRGDTAAPVS